MHAVFFRVGRADHLIRRFLCQLMQKAVGIREKDYFSPNHAKRILRHFQCRFLERRRRVQILPWGGGSIGRQVGKSSCNDCLGVTVGYKDDDDSLALRDGLG